MLAATKPPLEEVYLEHAGVKGMRWGFRKKEETGSAPRLSSKNQKLVMAAFVAGTVAVGAIMLKRGKIPVMNSTGTKIAMGGARISARILTVTGKVIVKSGTKTAKVTGKVGGKVATKVTVKTAQGLSRAAVNSGMKVYEKGLKRSGQMAFKLGSAASHRLTGIGTQWAGRVTQQAASRNPISSLMRARSSSGG